MFLVNNHDFSLLKRLTWKISKIICAREECKEKRVWLEFKCLNNEKMDAINMFWIKIINSKEDECH